MSQDASGRLTMGPFYVAYAHRHADVRNMSEACELDELLTYFSREVHQRRIALRYDLPGSRFDAFSDRDVEIRFHGGTS